jgi:hypothetical protein
LKICLGNECWNYVSILSGCMETCFVIGPYYQLCSAHVKKCGSLQGSKEMDVVTFVFWCDF